MKKTENTTKNKGFRGLIDWVREHAILFLIIGGVLLMVMTLKTQSILVTDTEKQQYTIELNYSVFGYCVSANPMTDEAKPVAAEYMFFLGGIDDTVEKAATWISETTDSGVEVYVSGYPRGKTALTEHLCKMLGDAGIEAKEFEEKE